MPKGASKGVFMLRFKDTTNAKHLFWSQETAENALQDFITKTNSKLTVGATHQSSRSFNRKKGLLSRLPLLRLQQLVRLRRQQTWITS